MTSQRLVHGLALLGVVMFVVGCVGGLTLAPPEQHMGDVSRILYVHLPAAWNYLLAFTFAFVFAVASLWGGKRGADVAMVGALEAGVVLNVVLLLTGMLFARPTWGIWWDWDVRLTTSFVSLVLFGGVLVLRTLIDSPTRRATWSAIATIIAFVDIPVVYLCVRWWRSLHQIQSSPETMSGGMVWPIRVNAFAVLFFLIWFIAQRAAIERRRLDEEETAPPPRVTEQVVTG